MTGPQIEALPGRGRPKRDFVGLASPPVEAENEGLEIAVLSHHVGSLKKGSLVRRRNP